MGYSSSGISLFGQTVSGPHARQFVGIVLVQGNFTATGVKNVAVPFPGDSYRALYCLESPES